jgi:hypothetical protein
MGKKANRVLLDLLDFGDRLPSYNELGELPEDEWKSLINCEMAKDSELFEKDKFTEL